MNKKKKRLIIFLIIFFTIALIINFEAFHVLKPLPKGINFSGKDHLLNQDDIKFLYDLTYKNEEKYILNQSIFNEIFNLIDNAEKYILIDMFLFNSFQGKSKNTDYINLSQIMTGKLIQKKKENPNIKIDFITDPINISYGGSNVKQIDALKNAGINVIITDLTKLRDSNPIYSVFWRLFIKHFGNSSKKGLFPHPFSKNKNKVTLRSYLRLLNFKANHRKVIIADNENNISAVITSANPHDASSYHSNVAFLIKGNIAYDIYKSEKDIAKLSGKMLNIINKKTLSVENGEDKNINVKLITENQIKKELLQIINNAEKNDSINIAQFYFSDRKILNALIKAAKKDVIIKIILDPNKDAFGYEKNGVPNRITSFEMNKRSMGKIKVRWYNTYGEQFHTKLFLYLGKNETHTILGSANYTRRNLNNLNLEMNIKISSDPDSKISNDVLEYFEMIWENKNEIKYTSKGSKYMENDIKKIIQYRIQEFTGFCTY